MHPAQDLADATSDHRCNSAAKKIRRRRSAPPRRSFAHNEDTDCARRREGCPLAESPRQGSDLSDEHSETRHVWKQNAHQPATLDFLPYWMGQSTRAARGPGRLAIFVYLWYNFPSRRPVTSFQNFLCIHGLSEIRGGGTGFALPIR